MLFLGLTKYTINKITWPIINASIKYAILVRGICSPPDVSPGGEENPRNKRSKKIVQPIANLKYSLSVMICFKD